jgi:RNA-directed DNA polymerase
MLANDYKNINWKLCNIKLLNLQHEILKAFRVGNKSQVKKLQHDLIRSFSARALAIRKISSNKGNNTPGIDGQLMNTDELKMVCINRLKNLKNYKASPVKRIHIRKNDGKTRPIGIPTFFDRAVQTLFLFTIEPIMEEISCDRAYGFRLGKSLHDCATYLFFVLASVTATRRFILCTDIDKFFDSVSHTWLLNNVPMNRAILHEFLKAGFLHLNVKYATHVGFPQGSPISPALANIALSGMQKFLGPEFLCTRFADDFVVLGKTFNNLKTTGLTLINEFIALRGLKLNLSKTKIYNIQEGFDFLGLNFREYSDKTRIRGTKLGALLIKPKKSKINEFIKDLTQTVKSHKNSKNFLLLIIKLNQKLRGFAEHYRKYVAKKIFSFINFRLFKTIYSMIKKKHRGRNATWRNRAYFCKIKKTNWNFCYKIRGKVVISLFNITQVPIKRHRLAKTGNPYDPENYANFKARTKLLANSCITSSKTKAILLTKQKGYCPVCGERLQNQEDLNIHHISPKKKGGSHKIKNLLLLHKICHVQVEISTDTALQATFLREGFIAK